MMVFLRCSSGFCFLLMEETGIPVVVAEDPLTCVARGGGKALEMIDMHGGDLFSEE